MNIFTVMNIFIHRLLHHGDTHLEYAGQWYWQGLSFCWRWWIYQFREKMGGGIEEMCTDTLENDVREKGSEWFWEKFKGKLLLVSIESQCQRIVWVGKDLKHHLIPTLLPWAGKPSKMLDGTEKHFKMKFRVIRQGIKPLSDSCRSP